MSQLLDNEVKLTVNCDISHEISSRNSRDVAAKVGLDGISLDKWVHPDVRLIRVAEQTLRQAFKDVPDMSLQEVDFARLADRPTIIASLQSHRAIRPMEVALIEDAIRNVSGERTIGLIIRTHIPYDVTRRGRIILGEMQLDAHNERERKLFRLVRESVGQLGNLYVKNVDGVKRKDYWELYVEILGDRVIRPDEVKRIEKEISDAMNTQVKIRAWTRAEIISTDTGFRTGEKFMDMEKDTVTQGRIEGNLKDLLNPESDTK
jgi:hypothetical protein